MAQPNTASHKTLGCIDMYRQHYKKEITPFPYHVQSNTQTCSHDNSNSLESHNEQKSYQPAVHIHHLTKPPDIIREWEGTQYLQKVEERMI